MIATRRDEVQLASKFGILSGGGIGARGIRGDRGRQWLTGRFDRSALTDADGRHKFPRFTPDALAANQPILDEVIAVAREAAVSPAQVALAWLYDKGRTLGLALSPIPGSRFTERVDENLAATNIRLDAAHVARLGHVPLSGVIPGVRSLD